MSGSANVDIREIVAITFTDRAAQELKDRLRAGLFAQLADRQAAPDVSDRIARALSHLEGAPIGGGSDWPVQITDVTLATPVIVDNFDYPVLYYAANTRLQRKMQAAAPIAGYEDATQDPANSGIYTHMDNGVLTGAEGGPGLSFPAWDLAGIGPNAVQGLMDFGSWTGGVPIEPGDFEDPANTYTFPNYILNKDVYESTWDENGVTTSLLPYRPDSFLLITPGPDGIYGSDDDVTNFR